MKHFALERGSLATLARTLARHPLWSLMAARKRAAALTRAEDLDDHMLRDIGLTRDAIASAVRRETQFPYGPTIR
jgi:uncharacterized protein YjiS (DUF1127 family)